MSKRLEDEHFLSGYCRVQDQSRMVTVVTEDGRLIETDCCYGGCVYQPNCTIAQSIDQLQHP